MGNWRTVRIVGACDRREVEALRRAVSVGKNYEGLDCLSCTYGLAGFGMWPAEVIDRTGNLAERDYDPEDVHKHLARLALAAPSLSVDVHCGGDYEDKTCVATVRLRDGACEILPPQVETVGEISEGQMLNNFRAQMMFR